MTDGPAEKPTRRPGGRNARVRARILDATVELVARHGIAGLSYDDVAELAGVHRTSVFRNWPDRAQLVRDALLRYADDTASLTDTGDLRRDLVDYLLAFADSLATSAGRALWQATQAARESTDLLETVNDVFRQRQAMAQRRVDSAVERGELPALDSLFLAEMLCGPAYLHVSRGIRPFVRADAERITDVVLAGVRHTMSAERSSFGG